MTEIKKLLQNGLVSDREGFRVSTPVEIASYIAKRLSSRKIADLGCGIGIQTINFATVSEFVTAVDIDRKRLEMCRRNCDTLGIKNVNFILGDAISESVARQVGDVDVIHSDPSRAKIYPPSMDSLSPNPLMVQRVYRGDMCFDLPATMPENRIPKDWELEFISLKGELKRLCAYTGGIRTHTKSAVTLPSEARIVYDPEIERTVIRAKRPLRYIYDVDPSLSVSGLLPEFIASNNEISIIQEDGQRVLATSRDQLKSPFLVKRFSVVGRTDSKSGLKKVLRNLKIGSVFPRYRVDPSSYYKLKMELENGLRGEEKGYIFRFENTFYIAIREE
ncbi:MAG: class I SAM-dependent methyltransferase [Thermoplasmatales archaeon]